MTLCAIGLWYWFRVPFEVVTADKIEFTREWRLRTWGGTLLHGPRRVFHDGKLVRLENYQSGAPHGRWEWRTYSGDLFLSAEYDRGLVQAIHPGPGCDKRLAELVINEGIDNQRIRGELLKSTSIDFTETPLQVAVDLIKDMHGIPIVLDLQALRGEIERPPPPQTEPPRKIKRIDAPVTCKLNGEPLIVGLGTILQPQGLVCDYRYGCLWITTPQLAGHDRTGMDKLVPPPNSQLARIWDEPSPIDFIETPLADALSFLSERDSGLKFDLSHLPPDFAANRPIIISLNGSPVRHMLGALLDRAGCKASLEGETIVVELQD